jgi:hypothetical protein
MIKYLLKRIIQRWETEQSQKDKQSKSPIALEYERLNKEIEKFKDVKSNSDKIIKQLKSQKAKVLDKVYVRLTDDEWLELIDGIWDKLRGDLQIDSDRPLISGRKFGWWDIEGLQRAIHDKYTQKIKSKKLDKIQKLSRGQG